MMEIRAIVVNKLARGTDRSTFDQGMLVHQHITESARSCPPAPQNDLLYRQRPPHEPQAAADREGVDAASLDDVLYASLELFGKPFVGIKLHRPGRRDRQRAHGEIPLV